MSVHRWWVKIDESTGRVVREEYTGRVIQELGWHVLPNDDGHALGCPRRWRFDHVGDIGGIPVARAMRKKSLTLVVSHRRVSAGEHFVVEVQDLENPRDFVRVLVDGESVLLACRESHVVEAGGVGRVQIELADPAYYDAGALAGRAVVFVDSVRRRRAEVS